MNNSMKKIQFYFQIAVKFVFYISAGNWYLNSVKYGDQDMILNIVGTRPSGKI